MSVLLISMLSQYCSLVLSLPLPEKSTHYTARFKPSNLSNLGVDHVSDLIFGNPATWSLPSLRSCTGPSATSKTEPPYCSKPPAFF